ncbi:UBL3 protein, partial [Atractosteus spatula]|nr:UBL3 protein [Atractosteus spatula]
MDWEEEQVSSPGILRLIYQGRFLHGNVTLGALKLPPGRTTVMHLVARETLPEPNSHGEPAGNPAPGSISASNVRCSPSNMQGSGTC